MKYHERIIELEGIKIIIKIIKNKSLGIKGDKEIIEYLVDKYGCKGKHSLPRADINNRLRKALKHRNLFYDEESETLKKKIVGKEDTIKFMLDFIKSKGLQEEYKKLCLKELIL